MYPLIRLLFALSSLLSFTALRRVGMALGTLYYYVSPSRRKVAEKNAEVIGARAPKAVAKSSFRHSFATFAESMYSHRMTPEMVEKIEIENLSGAPVDTSKSYFMITAHIGCWELAAVAFTMIFDTKCAVIGRKMKNGKINEFLIKQRENDRLIHISHRNVAERVPECLENGISVGSLLDHSAVQKDSIFIPFFGKNTTFIKGIPTLSVRRNVDILPVFMVRTDRLYKMIIYPAISPDMSLKPKERIYDVARRVNEVYEDIIRKYPDQWYLLHKRFKKQMDEKGEVTDTFYR
jgi:KDO2-lipid IV(A) lauroyltransferase